MLRECPNPDCDKVSYYLVTDQDPYKIRCDSCDTSGPSSKNEDDAVRLWNNLPRASVPDSEAMRWYRGTDTGISSLTIFEVMTGHPTANHSPPWDPNDFGRCYRLLDKFLGWELRMDEVADRFPEWKPLVDNWLTLKLMYIDKDESMYEYMKELMGR